MGSNTPTTIRTRAGWRICFGWESCPRVVFIRENNGRYAIYCASEASWYAKEPTNLLSIQNLYTRNTGQALNANRIKQLKVEDIDGMLSASDLTLAIKANLSVLRSADEQVQILEQAVGERVKLRPEFSFLKTVPGIGRFWMFQRQHCIKLFTMCMQRSGAATILF